MTPKEIPGKINKNMIFRLNSQRSPKEVNLLHLEWAVITQLDGVKTVGEIANLLSLNKDESQEIFGKLWKAGLLEYFSESQKAMYVAEPVLNEIEYELTILMGPVASVLIDETLKFMGKNRHRLDKQNLPNFLDLITNQVLDREKQLVFQKKILDKLRQYLLS